MAGNPISCHNNYRQKVAGYLHISASFSDFYLDKIKLSKKEKAIVGIQLCAGSVSLSNSSVAELSRNSFQNKFMTKSNHSEEQRNTTRKSGKTRVVAIPNLDDGTYEETENDNNSLDLMSRYQIFLQDQCKPI